MDNAINININSDFILIIFAIAINKTNPTPHSYKECIKLGMNYCQKMISSKDFQKFINDYNSCKYLIQLNDDNSKFDDIINKYAILSEMQKNGLFEAAMKILEYYDILETAKAYKKYIMYIVLEITFLNIINILGVIHVSSECCYIWTVINIICLIILLTLEIWIHNERKKLP